MKYSRKQNTKHAILIGLGVVVLIVAPMLVIKGIDGLASLIMQFLGV